MMIQVFTFEDYSLVSPSFISSLHLILDEIINFTQKS